MQLNQEQLQALQTFKVKHGARWKDKLLQTWQQGSENQEPYGSTLRKMRSSLGEKGLREVAIN